MHATHQKSVGVKKDVNIRFVSTTTSFESTAGHHVRTLTERQLCDWLERHEIPHQHANEVFIVRAAANGSPALFVPDVVLVKKTHDGKTIIIESLHSFAPKRGGLKTLSAFRKQYGENFFVIVVAKKAMLDGVPRSIADARVDLESLDMLEKKIEKLIA
jgi:hypothetical protein